MTSISVVVPVRNGMPYLPQAIGSVMGQLAADDELVVRDNQSTDGTSEWLASLDDPRVRVLHSGRDDTAGENWTAVAKEARGEYVKLLCADDFVTPGGLARQLVAAKDTGAAMVASRRTVVDSTGRTVIGSHGLGSLVGRRSGRDALSRSIASGTNAFGEPSAVLMRRDVFQSALPFTARYPYLTDLDLYARVLAEGDFVGLPSVDAGFRLSATSWSSQVGNAQLREFREWVDERVADGGLTLSPRQRVSARVAIPAMFLARRVINQLSTRRSPR